MQLDQLIRKARLRLFTKELIFFGIISNKFKWEITPLEENIEGYVQFSQQKAHELEYGKIFINKNIITNEEYTPQNLTFLLIHEISHYLHKHGLRKLDRNPILWNVACDHVIEVELKKRMSHIIQPYQNRYNIIKELESENLTAEEAYDWLNKNLEKYNYSILIIGKNSAQLSQNNQPLFVFNINDQSNNKDQIQQFFTECQVLYQQLKERGVISSNIAQILDGILKVKVPWDTILEKAIKTNTRMQSNQRNWRIPNKYYIPHNMYLPGNIDQEETIEPNSMIITLDSSASISSVDLKRFLYIVHKSINLFTKIILLVHDTQINQQKEFDRNNSDELLSMMKVEGIKGRGGTSHLDTYEFIQKYWNENTDELSLVISLTDGYTDISEIYDNYKWCKNLPYIILLTQDGYLDIVNKDDKTTIIKIENI